MSGVLPLYVVSWNGWMRLFAQLLRCFVLSGACIAWSAYAAPSVSELKFSDVTPRSFCVSWNSAEAVDASLVVYSDPLGEKPAVVTLQRDMTTTPGLFRFTVSQLVPDTAYFVRTTTKFSGKPAEQLFAPGHALLSVVTQKEVSPHSAPTLAVKVTGGVSGAQVLLDVGERVSPLSAMARDGLQANEALFNTTNLFNEQGETLNVEQPLALSLSARYPATTIDTREQQLSPELSLQRVNWALGNLGGVDANKDSIADWFAVLHGITSAEQDIDNDGLSNLQEYLLGTDPKHKDSDRDGIEDQKELELGTLPNIADTDRDGLLDGQELVLGTQPLNSDSDHDSVADGKEVDEKFDPLDATKTPVIDSDLDGIADRMDNCASLPNPDQIDSDKDGLGNPCDEDDDGDGIADKDDNAPLNANPLQEDNDNDGIGDAADNCAQIFNPGQENHDEDSLGDACDDDDDNDGWPDQVKPGYKQMPSSVPIHFSPFVDVTPVITSKNIPYTGFSNASISFFKFSETSGLQRVGEYLVAERRYVGAGAIRLDMMNGILAIQLDTYGCDCFTIPAGAQLKIVYPHGYSHVIYLPEYGISKENDVLFVATDGSTYHKRVDIYKLADIRASALLLNAQQGDNCSLVYNPDQSDLDKDGIGDVCDTSADDQDGDTYVNWLDNCPTIYNPSQLDTDKDGLGNECDLDDDGDGLNDEYEQQNGLDPENPDTNGDGVLDGNGDDDSDGISNSQEQEISSKSNQATYVIRQGLNLFSWPVAIPDEFSAYDLITFLGGAKNIKSIRSFDPQTNSSAEVIYDGSGSLLGDDFPIQSGHGYMIDAVSESVKNFSGSSLCEPIIVHPGSNLIGFPCVPANMTAYQLIERLSHYCDVRSLQRYNAETGAFETAGYNKYGNLSGVDFKITSSEGYFLQSLNAGQINHIAYVPPGVSVSYPENGAYIDTKTIIVKGVADAGTNAVLVNGVYAKLKSIDSDVAFEAEIPLSLGGNKIKVEARNNNAQSTIIDLSVNRYSISLRFPMAGEYDAEGTTFQLIADYNVVDALGFTVALKNNSTGKVEQEITPSLKNGTMYADIPALADGDYVAVVNMYAGDKVIPLYSYNFKSVMHVCKESMSDSISFFYDKRNAEIKDIKNVMAYMSSINSSFSIVDGSTNQHNTFKLVYSVGCSLWFKFYLTGLPHEEYITGDLVDADGRLIGKFKRRYFVTDDAINK